LASEWLDTSTNVFSALGTVGAFVVGFVLLRREQNREADRTEEGRRAQAAKVSAWVGLRDKVTGGRELAFHVHNASDMPIYEVELPLPARSGEDLQSEFVGLVPPGQTVLRPAPLAWMRSYVEPEPVQIEFLDSAGRRWTRDEQGSIKRAPSR
jgi:hypothetical protein